MLNDIYKKVAEKVSVPWRVVEQIMDYQWKQSYEAMKGEAKAIEMSGLGRFTFSDSSAKKTMNKLLSYIDDQTALLPDPRAQKILKATNEKIDFLVLKGLERKVQNTEWVKSVSVRKKKSLDNKKKTKDLSK